MSDPCAELQARISRLPFPDQLIMLVSAVVEHDREAFSAVASLAELTVRMSKQFGTINKFRLAEILRRAADRMEHEGALLPLVTTDKGN
jgi:hypothetical protein